MVRAIRRPESRDDYLALFEPLRKSRDVVLMDNRGTGKSGAIDCRKLQTGEKWTVEAVAACGESLGSPGGPLQHGLRRG